MSEKNERELRIAEAMKSGGIAIGDSRQPKFGEWLRGIWASERNPIRDGMYVRTIRRTGRMNPGTFYELTNGNGKFWEFSANETVFIAAAPSQEVEPVAVGIFKGDKMIGWNKVGEAKLLDETESAKDLYLSSITAEQAAADMKRRCMDIVKNWRRVHALEECCDHAQYVALSEVEKLIESLPTSDTAMEEMRREPSIGLLTSMAIRYDHGLGIPGYYDTLPIQFGPTHKQRMESAIKLMRQLYEEVSGQGFYKPERESEYASIAAENSQTEPKVTGSGI